MIPFARSLGLFTAVVSLVGCASTPEAMQQASHTVTLMSAMEAPLTAYRQAWAAMEQARLRTLKVQRQRVADVALNAERDRLARVAAGDTRTEALREKLLANADAMHGTGIKSADAQTAYAEKLTTLLQPLPSATATITAAQSAVSKMGTELSKETRAKELLDFAKAVRNGVIDNKKAQEEAQAAADVTAQALSSPEPAAKP